jgi:predicted RNA-binding Zn ribbon-like protein
MSYEWPASHRYRAAPAPDGLALVHDFLNTVGIGAYGPDLLGDPELAQGWADSAVRTWAAVRGIDAQAAQSPELNDTDLPKLRALRDAIAKMVLGESPDQRAIGSVSASFALSDTGEVRLQPAGSGWRWLAAALWGEILLSQREGTWRRLKRCHNHQCGSTFYDRSKNTSGVWCNVKTCGNAANLRASRARRRDRERAAESPN